MRTMRVVAIAALLVAAAGCGRPSAQEPKAYEDAKRGLRLQYPPTWTVEEVAQQDVLLFTSPVQEAHWQTNVFVEVRSEYEPAQSHEQRLSTLTANLVQHKKAFSLQSSRVFTHSSGLPAAELVYTHNLQGVALTEKELLLWLNDTRVAFVTGSAVTSLWDKYAPDIALIQDSLRPAG